MHERRLPVNPQGLPCCAAQADTAASRWCLYMLVNPPPVSNAERQRQFRERNPGYYGRLHRKRQAELVARMQQSRVSSAMVGAASEPLMLPAPAEQDLLLQQMAAAIADRQEQKIPA